MRRKDDTHNRILESARDLFLTRGYAGTSMRSIASDAGVTTGALYHNFSSKDDIFVQVCVEAQEKLEKRFDPIIQMHDGSDRAKLMDALLDAYLAFYLEHPGYYRILAQANLSMNQMDLPQESREQIRRNLNTFESRIETALKHTIREENITEYLENKLIVRAMLDGFFLILEEDSRMLEGIEFSKVWSKIKKLGVEFMRWDGE